MRLRIKFFIIRKINNQLIVYTEAYHQFTYNYNDKWKLNYKVGPKIKSSQIGMIKWNKWMEKMNNHGVLK